MSQHISRKECRAAARRNPLAHHRLRQTCDTLRGNSGSPAAGEDGRSAKKYDFSFCSAFGCTARVGFDAGTLALLKRGVRATITIYPAAAADTEFALPMSLRGFTRGFEEPSRITQ